MNERDTTAVIERALAQGACTATDLRERQLEELALALAAEAPTADAAFAAELDERVREAFPSPQGGAATTRPLRRAWATRPLRAARGLRPAVRGLRPKLDLRRSYLPVLGGAASVLIALTIALSLSDDGSEQSALDGGDGSNGAAMAPETTDSHGGAAEPMPDDSAPRARSQLLREPDTAVHRFAVPRPRGGFAPGKRERRIERSASLALAAPADRLDRVAADISAVTDRHGGFVLRSSLTTGEEGLTTGGDFDLRIPVDKLQRALNDLADLGHVRSRTQAGEDVTVAFVTAGDRLESARAERSGLLARLEEAQTELEAEALRFQLDDNAVRINRLRSRIRELRVRTGYAAVGVTLEARDDNGSGATSDGVSGAAEDALDSLGDSLELAIRVLGVAIPVSLLAGGGVLLARMLRRRRREAALS